VEPNHSPQRQPEISVLFDVWLLMHLVSGLLDQALAEHELSGDEFGLYSLLRGFGPITPTQISRWTGMPATTVSAVVRRLTARGHVERTPHPDDRRSYLVGLTDLGVAAHTEATSSFRTAAGRVSDALGDDEAAQRAALQRLDDVLRAISALDSRPYRVGEPPAGTAPTLTYTGPALTASQEHEVRRYIEFVRRPD
jgi:DNA-binding MarR family transcriptional regulator